MFERLTGSLVSAATIVSACALTVFALGFSLYALLVPAVGPAWAAACVAGAAAVLAAITALVSKLQSERRKREEEEQRAKYAGALPPEVAEFLSERPLASLAVSSLVGFLAVRHPGFVRDVFSVFAGRR